MDFALHNRLRVATLLMSWLTSQIAGKEVLGLEKAMCEARTTLFLPYSVDQSCHKFLPNPGRQKNILSLEMDEWELALQCRWDGDIFAVIQGCVYSADGKDTTDNENTYYSS